MSVPKKMLFGISLIFTIVFAGLFFHAPARYAEAFRDGISLWSANVLPALFPFLFFSLLLTGSAPFRGLLQKFSLPWRKTGKLSPSSSSALLLAAVSGYPVGARLTRELSPALEKKERFRLACMSSTASPVFLVGTVGGILFENTTAGIIALLSHWLAVWLTGTILALRAPTPHPTGTVLSDGKGEDLLYDSLLQAVLSVLCVGGMIALFSVLLEMLSDLGLFRLCSTFPLVEGTLRGLFEMTAGCAFLARRPGAFSLALSCAIVTFGGGCILCQQAAYLKGQIPLFRFLLVKLLQAGEAFFLCLALAPLAGLQ